MGANKRPIPRFAPSAGAAEILRAALSRGGDPWPEFAARFAGYLGVAHAVPAPSAREALAAILGSLGLPKGGDVLMPALTFHSIPTVVRRCGFEVGFVDIDPGTLCLDAKFLKGAMKPGTVAILPVHLHGRAADMDAISELSRRYGLAVIEDCAQAAGGMYGGRRLGGFGDAAFFSFHPAKNLSALWAGMAVTGRSDVAAGVESAMASHPLISLIELAGRTAWSLAMAAATQPLFWRFLCQPALRACAIAGLDPIDLLTRETPGQRGNLDSQANAMPRPFQGRLAVAQLENLDNANGKRIRNGERLLELLAGAPGIDLPAPTPRGENIFHSFVVRVDDREDFRRRLLRKGFDSHPGNMAVPSDFSWFKDACAYKAASDAVRRMVHLPVHPGMSIEDVDRLAGAIIAVQAERAK